MGYLYTNHLRLYSVTATQLQTRRLRSLEAGVTRRGDRRHSPDGHFLIQEMSFVGRGTMGHSSNLMPSLELREQLERLATIVNKSKGSILFRRGDAVTGLFLVLNGKVSLGLETESPVFPARVLGAGCIAGLPGTVSGNPYSLTAEVVQDANLAYVPRQAVIDLLQNDQSLCFQVMELLSGEISHIRSTFKTVEPSRRTRA